MSAFPYEEIDRRDASSRRIEKLIAGFNRQQQQGRFSAGQLVVRHQGRVIINLALGEGQSLLAGNSITVTPDTLFAVYSAGKPMAALCIALLQQRGLLDLSRPVCAYLPDFGQAEKSAITLDDVLTHRAGILIPELWQDVMHQRNEDELWQRICETPPRYPLGTFAYMPGEFGWILSRLVRQVDGRQLPEFFRQEFAEPLGLREMAYDLNGCAPDDVVLSRWLGKPVERVAGANAAEYFEEAQTSLSLFSTKNPAISMVSNAASLAAFYDFLLAKGVSRQGDSLLSETMVNAYTQRRVAGWNRSLNTYLSIGRGFMLGTLAPSSFGWWNSRYCYGHAGAFSSLAFADTKTGISAAIVTNGNAGIKDFFLRFIPLAQSVRGLGNSY